MYVTQNVRGIIFFLGLTLNTVFWFIPITILALIKILLPILIVKRTTAKILTKIGENWISVNSLLIKYASAVNIDCNGNESLKPDGWYFVMANHQTWVDILILQMIFNRKIPFLKFFIKQELKWFPLLGIAFWALDMPFMKRFSPSYLSKNPHMKGKDLEITKQACSRFSDDPTSVVSFLEGTRFSKLKHTSKKSPYKNLLQPKAGGLAITLASMGSLFNSLVDVTIVYTTSTTSFWDLCCGRKIHVIVNIQERAPEGWLTNNNYANDRTFRKNLHLWLGNVWREKDMNMEKISKHYKDKYNNL